jgi:hypothetical protein
MNKIIIFKINRSNKIQIFIKIIIKTIIKLTVIIKVYWINFKHSNYILTKILIKIKKIHLIN